MERWIVKLFVLNIIFFSAFAMTLLPLKVSTYFHRQGQRGQRIISHMMCFGGGVFFAMYMLQMTPASLEIVQTYLIEQYNINYPLAEFVIGCGFLIMLLSESTFSWIDKRKQKRSKTIIRHKDLPHELLPNNNPITGIELLSEINSPTEVFTNTPDSDQEFGRVNPTRNEGKSCTAIAGTKQSNHINQVQLKANRRPNTLNKDYHKAGRNRLEFKDSLQYPMTPQMSVSSNEGLSPLLTISSSECLSPLITIGIKAGLAPLLCIGFSGPLHQQLSIISKRGTDNFPYNDEAVETENHSTPHVHASRSLVLLFALSLHHVFEGLSIGLKHSKMAVWNMCIAIVSHEVILAFSLGMQLVHTFHSKTKITIAAFICSIMSPVGVAAGMAILETGGQDDPGVQIANGLLQSLATGIFIYVTFFEILQDELGHNKANFAKVLWICAGFLSLSSLGLIAPKDEDIDEDSSFVLANSTDNETYTTAQ